MWPFSDPEVAKREFKRIVIRVPNPLGDMIMATPALDAIKERYPNATLVGHGTGLADGIYAGGGWFDEFIVVGRKESVFAQARRLKAGNFDACILLSGSLRTAFPPFFARIPHRLGYEWSGRTWTLTAHWPRPLTGGKKMPYPTKHYFLDLVAKFGCDGSYDRRVRLGLTEEDIAATDRWMADHGIAPDAGMLTMAVGAGFGPSKIWPLERFAAVSDAMVEKYGVTPVMLCGPAERDLGETVIRAAKHPMANPSETVLSTHVLKGLVSRIRVMLCNDIGPRHVAVAFERPIVCLMGPTSPIYTGTDMENQVVIREEGVECAPCHLKECPIDHRCLTRIGAERVLPHVEAAWEAETPA
ncbi:MAG: glycosyltransferase family 9 protein [Planctomycetota bacterium]|jgi:heptosyltransferase-2